jgi:hypothetical protein
MMFIGAALHSLPFLGKQRFMQQHLEIGLIPQAFALGLLPRPRQIVGV